jgi:hypothetical protein
MSFFMGSSLSWSPGRPEPDRLGGREPEPVHKCAI